MTTPIYPRVVACYDNKARVVCTGVDHNKNERYVFEVSGTNAMGEWNWHETAPTVDQVMAVFAHELSTTTQARPEPCTIKAYSNVVGTRIDTDVVIQAAYRCDWNSLQDWINVSLRPRLMPGNRVFLEVTL